MLPLEIPVNRSALVVPHSRIHGRVWKILDEHFNSRFHCFKLHKNENKFKDNDLSNQHLYRT